MVCLGSKDLLQGILGCQEKKLKVKASMPSLLENHRCLQQFSCGSKNDAFASLTVTAGPSEQVCITWEIIDKGIKQSQKENEP